MSLRTTKWRTLEKLKAEFEKRNIPWHNVWNLNEHNAKIILRMLYKTKNKICPTCEGKGTVEENHEEQK